MASIPSLRTNLGNLVILFFLLNLITALFAFNRISELHDAAERGQRWVVAMGVVGAMQGALGKGEIADTVPRIRALEAEYAEILGPLAPTGALHAVLDSDVVKVRDRIVGTSSGNARIEKALDDLSRRTVDLSFTEAQASLDNAVGARWYLVLIVSTSALLVLALYARIRARVLTPLGAITQALMRLANGDKEIQVPEVARGDEIGQMATAFEAFRSNAHALEKAREDADALARHDALTGLANRRLLKGELDAAIASSLDGTEHAVMLLDLDGFKSVNDLHGHAAGDAVLCDVAQRLERVIGKAGTVARLGGDEFAVVTSIVGERAEVSGALAERLIREVRHPVRIGEINVHVGCSVGMAFCRTDALDADGLLRAADLAMYRAKQEGRNTFRFFERRMDEDLRSRASLEMDFRHAMRVGEVRPFYQPLIDMEVGRICGFEVLARWHHPERGSIGPDVFVPMAERLGLMADLTATILTQACRETLDWDPQVRLAVNISPAQFQDPSLPEVVHDIITREGFPASRLEIEVTESALVGDLDAAKATLVRLQAMGIKVALDDFGTGYSSLYHLRELKFDKLKIDKSFVQSMGENAESSKIVDAVLGLARSLGMRAVAEGIEDEGTMEILARRGCDYGQGYLFSKAICADDARRLIVRCPVGTLALAS